MDAASDGRPMAARVEPDVIALRTGTARTDGRPLERVAAVEPARGRPLERVADVEPDVITLRTEHAAR
jgi:chemotaxis response regulator CheB